MRPISTSVSTPGVMATCRQGMAISITEMEFNRAVECGIPILVFTIHDDHLLTMTMVEADKDAQEKLKKLKERACHDRGRLEFKSPVELRSHIIQSLGALLAAADTRGGWAGAKNCPVHRLGDAKPRAARRAPVQRCCDRRDGQECPHMEVVQ